MDAQSDYTDDDFEVANNCADFASHTSFADQMMQIDRLLIERRNKIDQGIREEEKKSGLIEAIFGTGLKLMMVPNKK